MFERWRKAWQQAKKNVEEAEKAKDDGVIRMTAVFGNEQQHETTMVDFGDEYSGTTPIDTEIAALVSEMNRVGIHTTCSCQDDDGEAYVSIRLGEGTTYKHRKDIFGPDQDELVIRWRRLRKVKY